MTHSSPITMTEDETPDTHSTVESDLPGCIEAALMGCDQPVWGAKLSELLGGMGVEAIQEAIEQLNKIYHETRRSFRIEKVAGGWRVMTLPQFAHVLAALRKDRITAHLTPAALETLAIIAYKQPIIRADVESIRGVASGEVIRGLLDRRLTKVVGRAEVLGRPMLYGTTKHFLEVFGLASLKDLPKVEEMLGSSLAASPPKAAQSESPAS